LDEHVEDEPEILHFSVGGVLGERDDESEGQRLTVLDLGEWREKGRLTYESEHGLDEPDGHD